MPERKWFDQSQPQTLQAAVLFSYLNAAIAVLLAIVFGGWLPLVLVPLLLLAVSGYAIANERRWGYWSAIVLSFFYLGVQILFFFVLRSFSGLISLLFAAVLVGLLLHPLSRQYQRIWFH